MPETGKKQFQITAHKVRMGMFNATHETKAGQQSISARVINMTTVKLLDEELVLKAAKEYKKSSPASSIRSSAFWMKRCALSSPSGESPTLWNGWVSMTSLATPGHSETTLQQFGLCADHVAETAQKMCSSL